jgi:hypothetical protein
VTVSGGNGGPDVGGFGGWTSSVAPVYSPPTVCNCNIIPTVCIKGSAGLDLSGFASKLAASLTKLLPDFTVKSVDLNVKVSGQLCTCCKNNQISIDGSAGGNVDVKVVLTAGPSLEGKLGPFSAAGWTAVSLSGEALGGWK